MITRMTCPKILCAAAVLLISSLPSVVSAAPLKVSVGELVKHPKKYNNKRVEVIGYWVTSCAHCSHLYASYEAEQKDPLSMKHVYLWDFLRPSIKMPPSFRRTLDKSLGNYDGYVRVIGTFSFTPMPDWVGKPISKQPPAPKRTRAPQTPSASLKPGELPAGQEVERIIVRGWIGPPEKRILKIRLLEPIGPPIPSRIEEFERKLMEKATRKNPR